VILGLVIRIQLSYKGNQGGRESRPPGTNPDHKDETMAKKIKKTCAVCFREIAIGTDGKIVRHGFKVNNRKNGQHGCAWQTGGCAGHMFAHYGLSADGTEYALEGVEKYIAGQNAALAKLDARPTMKYPITRYNRNTCKHDTIGHIDLNDGDVAVYSGDTHPGYNHVHSIAVKNVNKDIANARGDVKFFGEKIAQWSPVTS
jgi:hypothetical protein